MNFLSIDCSTDTGFLFIKIKNKSFSKLLQSDKLQNDLLMMKILDFFTENNIKLDEIREIFVNQGPGNFSGLRGSLAIAKGISISKNINLFGYDNFIFLSSNFFNKKDNIYSFIKFRDKYFVKKFNKKLKDLSGVKEVSLDEILEKYENKFKVIASNMLKQFDKSILKLNNLNIVDLDYNNLEFLKTKRLLNKDLIRPIYLN
tara:strand:+ start:377 stop:982 length:606 start_codon:yes stop_codon:yes gene_type:complete